MKIIVYFHDIDGIDETSAETQTNSKKKKISCPVTIESLDTRNWSNHFSLEEENQQMSMIEHNRAKLEWQNWNEVFVIALIFYFRYLLIIGEKRPDTRQNQSCVGWQRRWCINQSNGGNDRPADPQTDIVTFIEPPSQSHDWEIMDERLNTSEGPPQILVCLVENREDLQLE